MSSFRVFQVSSTDVIGGAARAAYRLHRALLNHGTQSRMRVRDKKSDDWTVVGPKSKSGKVVNLLRPALGGLVTRLQKSDNVNFHSGNWLPSAWSGEFNTADAEVVNLHWVGAETLSIEDIGRIRKPLVWTMHDMWPFCGTEHYADDSELARWRSGYGKASRSATDGGLDLDRLVWLRKHRAWKRPIHIVSPSRWLADCASRSVLLEHWPVLVIPNVLDTGTFRPLDRDSSRAVLGLPLDRQIILFGAMGGGNDPRKGYDLLLESLSCLAHLENMQNVLLVVFGQSEPENPSALHFPALWVGHVHDDTTLAMLYNSADVVVVPSRQENLPQTATEAQACGCPVVAFNCTGLPDVVVDQETGYLAKTFDVTDLAHGIKWILSDPLRRAEFGRAAAERAQRLWAPEVVIPQYLSVYRAAIG